MDRERSTEKGLILSFIAFFCIIPVVAAISLVSINRTTADLQDEYFHFSRSGEGHARIGLVREIGQTCPFEQYGAIAEFVLAHHERWDGTGYPSGFKGSAIPLQGRILALADSYALMTTVEPNGSGLSDREVLGKISVEAGSKYDPELTKLLTQLVLGDNRMAVLLSKNTLT